jgi:hypothetical protein
MGSIFDLEPPEQIDDEKIPLDRWGRFKLPNDDGVLVGRTRMTTVAKAPEDLEQLYKWKMRQAIWGLCQRHDLYKLGGSAAKDDKATLNQIIEDALAAAGIGSGANQGTALHNVFDRWDQGEPIENFPEHFHTDILARQETLDRHGITILSEYNEVRIFTPLYELIGTIDKIGKEKDGTLVIIDTKSGAKARDYPHAPAIQLGGYANADRIWTYTDGAYSFKPMPRVRKDYALLELITPESGECDIVRIDISLGWHWGARLAMETRAWRAFGPLVHPYISPGSWQPKQSKPFVADPTPESSEDVELAVEIPGADERIVASAITPEGRAAPNAFMSAIEDVRALMREETNGQAHSAQITEKLKSGKGIVPEVEAEELVAQYAGEHTKTNQPPKEWWQDKARSVGVTELNRHIRGSRGLALLYVNARNAAGMTEREWTEHQAALKEVVEPETSSDDRELSSILEEIASAPDNKALSDIWCRYRDARGVEAAERDILKAGTDRMEAIRKAQLVASDSPFA